MQKNIVHTPVSEVMTPRLITCSPYATLAEANEIMVKNRIRRLPVLDNAKKLIGIITVSDILFSSPPDIRHRLSQEDLNKELSKVIVDVIMTRKPVTVFQNDSLGHAAELMLDDKIGGLPVTDVNGEIVGIITESDIFRKIAGQWREDNMELSGAK